MRHNKTGTVVHNEDGYYIKDSLTDIHYPMSECFDMYDGMAVVFTPSKTGWVDQRRWNPINPR